MGIPPINIRIGNKIGGGGFVNSETMINSATNVSKNMLESMKVLLLRDII